MDETIRSSDSVGDQDSSNCHHEKEVGRELYHLKTTKDTSITSSKPRGGNKRPISAVWPCMNKINKIGDDGKVRQYAICKTCGKELPADSKRNGTTGLKNHLIKCVGSPLYQEVGLDQPILTQDSFDGSVVPYRFDQRKGDRKCVEWVILSEQSFKAVEHPALRAWIKEIAPRYKMPNRKSIARMVLELFLDEKRKIKSVISDSRVSITIDTWTSLQNINYMVVNAHFLDSAWNLHKIIINFTKITSHEGKDIDIALDTCLSQWGINKVFSITVDNTSANDVAVDYMVTRLKSQGTLLVDGAYFHMRCACDIINLVVRDGMKELNNLIESIRNCVKFIHSSAPRLDMFRSVAVLEKFEKSANVPLDVVTRWNSTYSMLNDALKYKKVFSRLTDENDNFKEYFVEGGQRKKGPPSEDDWQDAAVFVSFLKKFNDATNKLSATLTPTSNILLQTIFTLQIHIYRRVQDGRNLVLQRVAESMKTKFDKYWAKIDEVVPIIYVAQSLDPRAKLDMIEPFLKKLDATEGKIFETETLVKKHLYDLCKAYKGGKCEKREIQRAMIFEKGVRSGGNVDETMLDDDDDTEEQIIAEVMLKRKEETINEVDKYLKDPFESPLNEDFNILEWWRMNVSRYPILSKVAKDVLALPTSTVASNSDFSLGGRVVDPFKASLTPKMVEALICASDWLRGQQFDFMMDMTEEEEVEFYKELEEIEIDVDRIQRRERDKEVKEEEEDDEDAPLQ